MRNKMTYIIAEPCFGVCDTACVEVCPNVCLIHRMLLGEFISEKKDCKRI